MSWLIYDTEDLTYHAGAGAWSTDDTKAVRYESWVQAQTAIDDCGNDTLKSRLEIVPEN